MTEAELARVEAEAGSAALQASLIVHRVAS